MPCNCGNKQKKEYIYTNAKGEQEVHQTLLDAKAAKIRAGGVGAVREQVKR